MNSQQCIHYAYHVHTESPSTILTARNGMGYLQPSFRLQALVVVSVLALEMIILYIETTILIKIGPQT